ncbi:MAG: phospholipid carrier-dependent glycosyltransferase [Thermoguttaceae bacterium]|nr:phospholipid carrier-dependent glycosyltransferase [Thermoguttaceae bacterium]
MSEPSSPRLLTAVLLTALGLRLAAALWWEKRVETAAGGEQSAEARYTDGPFFFGDSDSYWKLGRALAFGRPYRFDPQRHWKVFRMPGYPALLAPLFWLGGENPPVFWGRVLGAFFGTLTVLFTALLARQITSSRAAALLAGVIAAVDPTLIFQSVLILSDEAFTAVMLLQLAVLVRFSRLESGDSAAQKFLTAFLLGLASAAAVYLRPGWLDFLPFALVVAAFLALSDKIRHKEGFSFASLLRRFTLPALTAVVVFVLAMAPWWLRSWRVTGHFVATTLQGGASLYDGLSPEATGASDMRFVDTFREAVTEEILREFPQYTDPPADDPAYEIKLDRAMKTASVDWAKAHPREVLRLGWVKFCRLWNLWPNEPSFRSAPIRLGILLTYGPILFLALVGAIVAFRHGSAARLLLFPALYVTCLHVIFVSSLRYRIPAIPPMIILAVIGVLWLWRK